MNFEEIIDLTYPLEEGMPTYMAPWHPLVEISQMGRLGLEGRETRKLVLGTHTGTHLDAPRHFLEHGLTIDRVPLGTLVGDVTIVDCAHVARDTAINASDLAKLAITPRMIFRFNWFKNWNQLQYYKDWPYFTKAAAQHLVDRGVKLIGLDTPSPDDSRTGPKSAEDSPIHKIFLGAGVILLEYLNNLDMIKDLEGWTLIALPLKIRDGDGAPARVCLAR